LSVLALSIVLAVSLLGLAPAIYAAYKNRWAEIAIWASGTLIAVVSAYMVPVELFRAAMFAVVVMLELWLWHVAEQPMHPLQPSPNPAVHRTLRDKAAQRR
jgi:uncharacterized membrane protein